MVTIKSFTTLEQSKKLAEILPLESADMRYDEYTSHIDGTPKVGYKEGITEGIPCWSLAALLDTFPKDEYKDIDLCFGGYQEHEYIPAWFCYYEQQEPFIIEACYADNPINACYEMILKLHELKML